MSDGRVPTWKTVRVGSATVTFGKPYYGKRKIVANAPLTGEAFAELVEALQLAARQYAESAD